MGFSNAGDEQIGVGPNIQREAEDRLGETHGTKHRRLKVSDPGREVVKADPFMKN